MTVQLPDLPRRGAALLLDYPADGGGSRGSNPFQLIELEFPERERELSAWARLRPGAHGLLRQASSGPAAAEWWHQSAPRSLPGVRAGWGIDGRFELPRQRVAGTGTPSWQVMDVEPSFTLGIPVEWPTPEELAWCAAEGIHAVPIDPHDPPVFESQAAYLARHGLLLRGEERRLGPADFAPEEVTGEEIGADHPAPDREAP